MSDGIARNAFILNCLPYLFPNLLQVTRCDRVEDYNTFEGTHFSFLFFSLSHTVPFSLGQHICTAIFLSGSDITSNNINNSTMSQVYNP